MKKVMIVDDDEEDVEILCEAIDAIDPAIKRICVSDGLHALRLLQNEDFIPPDLIFLDLNMPRLGGRQCLEKIRSIPALMQVPVIIYSSQRLSPDLLEETRKGRIRYLAKPERMEDLERELRVILDLGVERSREKQ